MVRRRSLKLLLPFFILCYISSFGQTREDCQKNIATAVVALNKKEHIRSLQLLNNIKITAGKNAWHREEFLAINNIGANYFMMLDYGEALDHYLEAYKYAILHLDHASEMVVLNNIAILYSKEKKYTKAEEYFTKAYDIATKINDSTKIAMYATNLAIANNENGLPDKAYNYLTISRKYNKRKDLEVVIQTAYIDYLILKKNNKLAKHEALKLLPSLQKVENTENKIGLLLKLSQIYLEEKDNILAMRYAKLANQTPLNIENKEAVFHQLFNIALAANNPNLSKAYKDSIVWAKDSITVIKNGKLFENSRIKFEFENSQQQLSESHKKLKTERVIFIIIISLAAIVLTTVIWALRNSKSRQKQQKIAEERQQKINALLLEQEKNEKLLLENELNEKQMLGLLAEEKLKNEIEYKNRKLATKALYLSTRNSLIEDLIAALSQQIQNPERHNIERYISQLQQHLRQDNEYDNFFSHFEEINQSFLINLKNKHPDLTANDIRFLSYVYMNLSNKEISSLLNITLEACRKRKERISKKINLQDSSDLYNYITST